MLVLLKADQLGLFDKLVPIKGSVSASGAVTPPHMAIRHVRAPQPKAQHHAHAAAKPEEPDLFAAPVTPRSPHGSPTGDRPAPKPKPADTTADLFADLPPLPEPPVAPRAPAQSVNTGAGRGLAFGVPAGTSKERRRELNAEGAAIIAKGGDLTPADLGILRQYSGNGGCGDSLNEFYTDPKVAAAMWDVLRTMGLPEGATVLEPSCATGVFLETAPAGVRVTGVEMDPTSAAIGRVLHPGHEVQTASLERFAVTDTRQFDAVIGNAPFGLRGSLIKDDKPAMKTAEAYFMDTALDKAKDGGLVAMIVPTGIMNGKNSRSVRERLLRKGEFLGAIRMPNSAFEAAHTDVTSDILFFRKRPQAVAGALMVVDQPTLQKLGVWDAEFLGGSYFEERGAPNVLGTVGTAMRAFGEIYAVTGSMVGVPDVIAAFKPETPETASPSVAEIISSTSDPDEQERIRAGADKVPYADVRRGDTKVVDGVEYILAGDPLRWHRVDEFMQSPAVTAAQDLSDDIDRAIHGETVADLKERVEAYVAEHGIPSKNPDLMLAAATDKRLFRLVGAVGPDGKISDVVAGRQATPVESSFDAAAQTLAQEAEWFTPAMVAGRWTGGDAETVLDHLYASPDYCVDPKSGMWTSCDQYLSGDMWPKLDDAKAALAGEELKPEDRAKVERQAKLLEETIDPKSLEDVEINLNSAFLPLNVIAAWFNRDDKAFTGQYAPKRMELSFDGGIYSVRGGPWGSDLLGKYLNRTGVKKEDDLPVIERWNQEFKAWLCASPYRDEIEDLYNRKFRGFRQRQYSDTPFDIPGLKADGLKSYQYSGLRWALEAGKGIIAADVGLGKTARGLILARLAKVTGQARKPIIVVPKSVLANWVDEAEKWFPGSSVLVIGETYSRAKNGELKGKQDNAAERNRKLHDLTQNDYDFVLIGQPSWNDIDLDPIAKKEYLDQDFWVQRGDALGNAGDKRINKVREAYDQAVAQRDFQKRTDAIYFNDLGVDMIIGDEFHAYKNLYAARNRFGAQPKFLGGSGLSNRALDTNLKCKWLLDQTGGRNVYGLTATPTKNSPLEIYSMLSHIAPEAFEKIGIRNSEEFLDRFCEFKNENVLNTRGEIEEALVTVGFKNLDELREIMRRYIDRKTAEDVGLQLPKRDDRMHTVDMTPEQEAVYVKLRADAVESAGKKDATGDMHIFSIMDRMGKAAMDLEMYDPSYKGAASPKYDAAVKEIAAGTADGGQVVFADNLMVHDKLVAALVAAGVPREKIGVMNAQVASTSAQRQNLTDAFNARKLDVMIGNTATMGEGQNLQKGTTDIHHMDLPWEPASMQQRNGRGLRQGNLSESVRIHTYLAKGSFDGYRYQSMMAKKDWQDLLWNGADRVENLAREGAMSREDMMVMLSADPDAARAQMTTNKAAAQERFTAQKNSEAASDFVRFKEMQRSFSALKNKATTSAERLKVKLDRARIALEENPNFKAKHALDATHPIVIQPQTGDAFEKGSAFELGPDAKVHGGGKFVVTGFQPGAEGTQLVKVRHYGAPKAAELALELGDLNHAKPFEYDEKAESVAMSAHLEEMARTKLSDLTSVKDLHGLPSAAVQSSYDAIQRQLKAAVREHKFTGYGNRAMIGPDGRVESVPHYEYSRKLDTHDFVVPTDEHREKVREAFMAAERGKSIKRVPKAGRRGGYTGEYETKVRYGDSYTGEGQNPWGGGFHRDGVADEIFGEGTSAGWRAEYDRGQHEAARHAPVLGDAIRAVAHSATGDYGTFRYPRRGLAVLWAKAKRGGELDKPWSAVKPTDVPDDAFKQGGASAIGYSSQTPVRDVLTNLAIQGGHSDLAAAMIVDGPFTTQDTAVRLLKLGDSAGMRDGLRHLIAKHPEMGAQRASQFMPGPHYGWKTLADVADEAGGGDERDAA